MITASAPKRIFCQRRERSCGVMVVFLRVSFPAIVNNTSDAKYTTFCENQQRAVFSGWTARLGDYFYFPLCRVGDTRCPARRNFKLCAIYQPFLTACAAGKNRSYWSKIENTFYI